MVSKDSDSLAANPSHGMILRSACSSVNCTAGSVCASHHGHKHSTNLEQIDVQKGVQGHSLSVGTSSESDLIGIKSLSKLYRSIRTVATKSTTTSFVQQSSDISEEHEQICGDERSASCLNTDSSLCQNVNILSQRNNTKYQSLPSDSISHTLGRNIYSDITWCDQMARTLCEKSDSRFSHSVANEAPDTPFSSLYQDEATDSKRTQGYSSNQSYLNEQLLVRSRINHRSSGMSSQNVTAGNNNNNSQLHQSGTSFWHYEGEENSDDESGSTSSKTTTYSTTETKGFLRYLLFWRKYLYFGLSKPTHYDFENLSRISSFGKKKAVLLLLLPLLIWFLVGAFRQEDALIHLSKPVIRPFETFYTYILSFMYMRSKSEDVSNNVLVNKVEDEKKEDIFHSLWGISSDLISSLIPRDYTFETVEDKPFRYEEVESVNHFISASSSPQQPPVSPLTYMSREEVQSLVRDIIRDEVASQISVANNQGRAWTHEEMSKLQREISSFQLEFKSITDAIRSMQISHKKFQMSLDAEKPNHNHDAELLHIRTKLEDLEKSFTILNSFLNSAKNCCRNQTGDFTSVESYLTSVLLSMTEEDSSKMNPDLKPFKDWLSSKFLSTKRTSEELKNMMSLIKSYNESTKVAVMDLVKQHMERVRHELVIDTSKVVHSLEQTGMLSSSDVQHMIKEAILLYDADKTGQTDYALESGGGSVVNTRCSETYNERSPKLTIFGIPLWSTSSSPRNAIQPDLHPGQCWAFRGSNGYLVIQLATTIRPTAFVIEHIPKSISPTGDISSAPKDFSVWGLSSEKDAEGKLLGRYTYDVNGEPLQYFPIQEDDGSFYSFVELKIHSNHGEIAYTCLYRFRVHGLRY